MSKKAKSVSGASDYVTVSSGGFPPNWMPEDEGESIEIIPIGIRAMKSNKKQKGMKQGYVLDAEYIGGTSESFNQGSGKNQVQIEVEPGQVVSINLNAALMGETENDRKLAYVPSGKGKKTEAPQFTLLAQALHDKRQPSKIVYHGTVPLGGGRKVKRFEILVPKAFVHA
jgi:hypothetical protein